MVLAGNMSFNKWLSLHFLFICYYYFFFFFGPYHLNHFCVFCVAKIWNPFGLISFDIKCVKIGNLGLCSFFQNLCAFFPKIAGQKRTSDTWRGGKIQSFIGHVYAKIPCFVV